MSKRFRLFWILAATLMIASACAGKAPEKDGTSTSTTSDSTTAWNKDDYPVFPDADKGADPSVPAEMGGKGFTGQGWETNTSFDLQADPHAAKGGVLRDVLEDFPGNLRIAGPENNSTFNFAIAVLAYEGLLSLDTNTLQYIPQLATHWQISPDKMTYRFRLNPNARFSDGTPVTADDVVASYDFVMDKTLDDPFTPMTYGKMERPVAESKYIVRVKAKQLNWRNFLYFSSDLRIFPAHVLKGLTGATYNKEYNFKLLPGTGPYEIRQADIEKGKSIMVRRRADFWGANMRTNVGLYNFDALQYTVIRDEGLQFEKFKKGELDYYIVGIAKQWVEETNFENVKRGLVQKRKIFNNQPWGFGGFAMNTRTAPFDDIRVRKALTFLTNRPLMIEKLAYNEYVPLNSYFPNSIYENPDNPKNPYDPTLASKLLGEAGWKERDDKGRLVKAGKPLEIEMLYPTKSFEKYLTVYQEDLRKIGVNLILRLVTPETFFQLTSQHKFQMAYTAYGGLLFPNPETSMSSQTADQGTGNNITGFKNARVDELCKLYDKMFNVDDRVKAIREIDGIVANDYQYVLLWTGPFTRVLYWNKFGAPPGYLSRTGDYFGAGNGPGFTQMWWIDSAKQAKLDQAQRDTSIKLDTGTVENHYWTDYDKRHPTAAAPVKKQ